MKLKCNDGKIRSFSVAHCDGDFLADGTRHEGNAPAYCDKCGHNFGCHDTKILKPQFKGHVCKDEKNSP